MALATATASWIRSRRSNLAIARLLLDTGIRSGGDERSHRLILGHRSEDSIDAYLCYVFGE